MRRRSPDWCLMRDSVALRAIVKHRLDSINPLHKYAIFERHLNIPMQTIGRYYRGERRALSAFSLMKLCQFLGITPKLTIDIDPTPSVEAMKLLQTRKKTKNESYFT